MRPPELNVRFQLESLHCHSAEDSGGDEPYLWVMGFKVDADTLGPPPGLDPITVQTFDGPAIGFGEDVKPHAPVQPMKVPPTEGSRQFRLRPERIFGGNWFSGLAGLIAVLWDNDNFTSGQRAAAHDAFRGVFGPALAGQLTRLINDGAYDDTLARDVGGNIVPRPPGLDDRSWRLSRMADSEVRGRALRAMRDAIISQVESAIRDALPAIVWDPDDLLGAEVQVYTGDELGSLRTFSLEFTGDEAHYILRGQAQGTRARPAVLDTMLTSETSQLVEIGHVMARVAFHEEQAYAAYAFRQTLTMRFELRGVQEPPVAVRWFIDGKILAPGEGTLAVHFEPMAAHSKPPESVLAPGYAGGPGTLHYRTQGAVLELWNAPANGVYFGEVRALYAFAGDPQIFDSLSDGYDRAAEFSLAAVRFAMEELYYQHVREAAKTIDWVDHKRIPTLFDIPRPEPGDPAWSRIRWQEHLTEAAQFAQAVDLRLFAGPPVVRVAPPTRRPRIAQSLARWNVLTPGAGLSPAVPAPARHER